MKARGVIVQIIPVVNEVKVLFVEGCGLHFSDSGIMI